MSVKASLGFSDNGSYLVLPSNGLLTPHNYKGKTFLPFYIRVSSSGIVVPDELFAFLNNQNASLDIDEYIISLPLGCAEKDLRIKLQEIFQQHNIKVSFISQVEAILQYYSPEINLTSIRGKYFVGLSEQTLDDIIWALVDINTTTQVISLLGSVTISKQENQTITQLLEQVTDTLGKESVSGVLLLAESKLNNQLKSQIPNHICLIQSPSSLSQEGTTLLSITKGVLSTPTFKVSETKTTTNPEVKLPTGTPTEKTPQIPTTLSLPSTDSSAGKIPTSIQTTYPTWINLPPIDKPKIKRAILVEMVLGIVWCWGSGWFLYSDCQFLAILFLLSGWLVCGVGVLLILVALWFKYWLCLIIIFMIYCLIWVKIPLISAQYLQKRLTGLRTCEQF